MLLFWVMTGANLVNISELCSSLQVSKETDLIIETPEGQGGLVTRFDGLCIFGGMRPRQK